MTEAFTLPRTHQGGVADRAHEMRDLVSFVLRNRGTRSLLEAMIDTLKEDPYVREPYCEKLIHDLEETLRNYEDRYP